MKTTLEQTLALTKDGLGSTRFQVSSTLSYVLDGDLPNGSIFVYQIGTITDPKSDVFLRIGDLQDITTLIIGRDAALLNGAATYIANGFTVEYSDVSTANAAKLLIQSRIDQLIADWRLYSTAFLTGNETLFPLQDASLVAAKKDAYVAAKKAKDVADLAVLAKATVVTTKQAAAVAAAEKQTLLQTISTECTTTKNALTAMVSPEQAFMTYVAGVVATLNAFTSDPALATVKSIATGLEAARVTAYSLVQIPLQTLTTDVTSSCVNKSAAALAAAGARAVADASIASAQRDAILAQQTANTAQTAVESALADAIAVCPTFDPTTV